MQINCSEQLRSCDVKTLPYPGFPTDLQPQLMSLLTTCPGQSVLEETVFEGRMRHGMSYALMQGIRTQCFALFSVSVGTLFLSQIVCSAEELRKLGAQMKVSRNIAIINGKDAGRYVKQLKYNHISLLFHAELRRRQHMSCMRVRWLRSCK